MTYTSAEMVRMELLQYENPEGLHPVESGWRDLSRKLMQHNLELQKVIEEHHFTGYRPRSNDGSCIHCSHLAYKKFIFPEAFKLKETAV